MAVKHRINAPSARRASQPDSVLERIEQLQVVQKRNAPTSDAWQRASAELQPLFAEMARRTQGGAA